MLLARYLERLPGHVRLYAVTLNVFGLVELGAFLAIFKSFREGIRERFGNSVKFRPVTEVGPRSGRLHSHIVMTSDGIEVTKDDVESIWRDSCGGRRIQVDHKPLWDIAGWCRYMWKDGWKWHDPSDPKNCVVLFSKGSPKLPQATPGFFPGKVKAELWEEWKANEAKKRRRAPEVVGNAGLTTAVGKHSGKARVIRAVEIKSGTRVPQARSAANIRINMGESTVKSRASGPYSGRRGCVQAIGTTANVEINIRKSLVFNRVTGTLFRAAFIRPGHRNRGEVRSIDLMPESRSEARPGRQARAP
jgi:hypothetical protein